MTPIKLDILLHCHISPTAHPQYDSPAFRVELQNLMEEDIVRSTSKENIFALTQKGEAWLRLILETPMPILQWIDPRNN